MATSPFTPRKDLHLSPDVPVSVSEDGLDFADDLDELEEERYDSLLLDTLAKGKTQEAEGKNQNIFKIPGSRR